MDYQDPFSTSILAVGTELTDGQVINRNAAWISERMKRLGARARLHLTVPDRRTDIKEALDLAARSSRFIFVTGGLGPTSDDFTREVISEWMQKPLVFHPESWAAVTERLTSRGYPAQEFQKQQCFFPEGAKVLRNSQGTANGFYVEWKDRLIIGLPGPPREIEAIWNEELAPQLNELCKTSDPLVTSSWDVLGPGESQVAALVEPLVADQPVEVGYRVHLPFVEFKITFPRSQMGKNLPLISEIEKAIGGMTVCRNGEDLASRFADLLKEETAPLNFYDEVTGSYLINRLSQPLRERWTSKVWTFRNSGGPVTDEGSCFWIRNLGPHEARIGWRRQGQTRESWFEAPQRSPLMSERRKQYFAEVALAFWQTAYAQPTENPQFEQR